MDETKCKVAIIGGGVSGLAAGKKLLDSNFKDFCILEARARLGGRMHTHHIDGEYNIDLGAHWIHGQDGNRAYDFIKEKNLPTTADEDFYANSVALSEGGRQHAIEPLVHCRSLVHDLPPDMSFKSVGDSVMSSYHEEKWKDMFGIDEMVLDSVNNYVCIVDASEDWFLTSITSNIDYQECPGNQILALKAGYSDLLTKCIQSPELLDRVKLSSSVQNIQWNNTSGGILIEYGNGRRIRCDYVICTLPLGVLKANISTLFSPPLPSAHTAAISNIQFGYVEKIFIEFPYQWWQGSGVTFLFEKHHRRKAQEFGKWEYGILGFYAVPYAPNFLCGWIKGEDARLMAMSPEEEVQRRCMSLLKEFIGEVMQVPDPIRIIRSQWSVDPWSYGSYSCRSTQTEEAKVYAKDLACPVFNNQGNLKLMFAGEATHSNYFSTVHGALESGEREALRVLREMESNNKTVSSERDCLYDVIIVGAGASGLAAARELKLHGNIRFCILEGSDYVGGRMKTVHNGNCGLVDTGAQWIHGENNQLFQSIKNFNLVGDVDSVDGKGQFYTENGLIPDEIARKATEFISAMQDSAITTSDVKDNVIEYYETEYRKFLDQFEDGSPEKLLYLAFYHFLIRWETIDNACSNLKSLSHESWQSFDYGEGRENMNPRLGYSSVIHNLLTNVNPQIHFNQEVQCIEYHTEGSIDTVLHKVIDKAPIVVHCKSGRKLYSSHILVSSSIGRLKETHKQLFKPPLPRKLATIIDTKIGFGTLNKIFLTFDVPWWGTDKDSIQFVHTKPYSDITDWKSHDIFQTKNTSTMEHSWMEGITGFDKIVNNDRTLCGWIGGREAEFMESLSDEQIISACLNLLSKFTGQPIPQPISHVVTRWRQDPFARGSYSSRTHGVEYIRELQNPIKMTINNTKEVPLLLFCGEALSINHYSTVHGAMESGTEQARKLAISINERKLEDEKFKNLRSKL